MARILLVDDEPSIRLFYQDVLADHGHDVVEATSGNEAMQFIQSESPDLVVLDIKLGPQNGLNVLRDIVGYNPQLPVIILTAYGSFLDDYTSWLAHSVVVKSSDPTELLGAVNDALKQGGSRTTAQRIHLQTAV